MIELSEVILPFRSKKQGDFRNSLVLLGLTPLWHVAQWVSRAPPHHTLPAFLNLNGTPTFNDKSDRFFRSFRKIFNFTIIRKDKKCRAKLSSFIDRGVIDQFEWIEYCKISKWMGGCKICAMIGVDGCVFGMTGWLKFVTGDSSTSVAQPRIPW